ncbi:bifunctional 3-dehydroquinate dehydratase/shikimate dehydrogenase, chloroplastic-like, partial [Neltuma alba]|uniref:bifunctional 3-dehydroquinate dehydratase/shikimate dehydrogenase, chloroplastic-like n=1 Tax=Neltuma alba TaxID=207710 RepID=UPI0010A33334
MGRSLSLAASDVQIGGEVSRNSTLVCAPIVSDSVDEMLIQMGKAEELGADLVELRLDFLNNFNPPHHLQTLIKHCPLPTLVTYRPTWEGGRYNGDESQRQAALRLAVELRSEFVALSL